MRSRLSGTVRENVYLAFLPAVLRKNSIRPETITAVLICAVCEILSLMFRDARVLAFSIFAVLIDAMTFVYLWLRSSSALPAENLFLRKQLAMYVDQILPVRP